MLRHIPNLLTCLNLLTGSLGILYLFEGDGSIPVAMFVWVALAFDFLDGFAARLLRTTSPIGKELDSLADVISFGLLPSVIAFKLIYEQAGSSFLPYLSLSIVIFSALRLAKFNIDESQSNSFRGLPTPANALFITGLPLVQFPQASFLFEPVVLAAISIIFSLLLVSPFEMLALKFRDFSWRNNKSQFTFLFFSVLLLVSLKFAAVPIIIIFYILFSLGGSVASGQRVK